MGRGRLIQAVFAALLVMLVLPAATYPPRPWPKFGEANDTDEMTPLYREAEVLMEEGAAYKALAFNRLDLLAGPASLGPVARHRSYVDLRSWQAGYLMQSVASGVKIVRVAAYQSLFGHTGTDFRALDILLNEALALDMRVALVLESHSGLDSQPEGEDKDLAWYHNGFRSAYGGYRHSLLAHVGHLARRYAGHPCIAWWEIIDRTELSGHPEILAAMVDEVGLALKTYDPDHLVAVSAQDWSSLRDNRSLDILAVNDLGRPQGNFPQDILDARRAGDRFGKPVIVVSSALSLHNFDAETRALEYHRRMLLAAEHDVHVFGLFHYDALPLHRDSFGIEAGDPTVGAVRAAALREYAMPDGRLPHLNGEPEAVAKSRRSKEPWWHVFRRHKYEAR